MHKLPKTSQMKNKISFPDEHDEEQDIFPNFPGYLSLQSEVFLHSPYPSRYLLFDGLLSVFPPIGCLFPVSSLLRKSPGSLNLKSVNLWPRLTWAGYASQRNSNFLTQEYYLSVWPLWWLPLKRSLYVYHSGPHNVCCSTSAFGNLLIEDFKFSLSKRMKLQRCSCRQQGSHHHGLACMFYKN